MNVNASLSSSAFQRKLAFGQVAESEIAKWIMHRGNIVLPIYDIEYDSGKGPRLFSDSRQYIAPDLLVFGKNSPIWIEAKHKTVFSWWRKGRVWETGIDRRHYHEYLAVSEVIDWPVWIIFLHRCSTPAACDAQHCVGDSPTGLFGNTLKFLRDNISHQSDKWAKGMVYWARDSLTQLATLDELD